MFVKHGDGEVLQVYKRKVDEENGKSKLVKKPKKVVEVEETKKEGSDAI